MAPIRLPLSQDKTLWLFSDTWIGKVRDGRRVDGTIVNNTVAIQQGKGPGAKVQFFVRRDEQGKALAFVVPADGHGWFWLQAGTRIGDKLYLFLRKSNGPTTRVCLDFDRLANGWVSSTSLMAIR